MVSKTSISETLNVVAVICTLYSFWFLLILWLIYKHWMATLEIQGHQLEPETAQEQGLLETDVERVFDTCMTRENSNEPSGGCAICLEEYKDGQTRAARTSCNHRFHAGCIMPWLSKNHTCPLCRNSLI